MSAITAKIRYLASCHAADNRESAIFGLFHRDVKHRHFAAGTEALATGLQDALAVPSVFPLSFASWSANEAACLEAIGRHLEGGA